MSVRSADLVLRAGGAAFDRFGVARMRTSPTEDIAEVFTRASTALAWDRNGVLRRAAIDVLRASWEDRDGDGVYETPTVPLSKALTQLVEFSIPGGSEASFETAPTTIYKAALVNEYMVRLETGDRYRINLPTHHTKDTWTLSLLHVADQDWSADGGHLFNVRLDDSNYVRGFRQAADTLRIEVKASGNTTTVDIGANIDAGTAFWILVQVVGGNVQVWVDSNGDGTLEASAVTAYAGTFAAGTYQLQLAHSAVSGQTAEQPGLYSALITNATSSTPLTDRFASGAGQRFATWFNTWAANLVLSVNGTASGPYLGTYDATFTPASLPSVRFWADPRQEVTDAGLTTPTIADTFDRANETLGATNAPTGQAYTLSGTWNVSAGTVRCPTSNGVFLLPMGTIEHRAMARVVTDSISNRLYKLVARAVDVNNLLYLERNNIGLELYKVVAGVPTLLVTGGTAATVNVHDVLEMRCTGNDIACYVNGVLIYTHTLVGADAVQFGVASAATNVGGRKQNSTSDTALGHMTLFMATAYASTSWSYLAQISDRSGNAFHMQQATAALQPLLVYDGTRWVFAPDGGNDYVKYPANTMSTASQGHLTVALAGLPVAPATTGTLFASSDEGSGTRVLNISLTTTSFLFNRQESADTQDSVTHNTTTLAVHTPYLLEVASLDTSYSGWVNGVAQAKSVGSGADNGDWFGQTALRDNFTMFGRVRSGAPDQFLRGRVCDYVLTDLAPVAADQVNLRAYLSYQNKLSITTAADLKAVTVTTATKGTALPALNGFGAAFGAASATITTPLSEGIADAFDAGISPGQGQKIVKLDTGPSGTQTRRLRLGLAGAMNGLTPSSYYSFVVGLYLKASSAITPANVQARIVDNAGNTPSSPMTAKGRWQWIPVQRQIGTTEAYIEIQAEDGVNFGTANDALYIALPTFVAGRCIPYPIANDAEGTVTQAAETLYLDFNVPPQGATIYLKGRERGSIHLGAGTRLAHIGATGPTTTPRWYVDVDGSGHYRAGHDNGLSSGSVTSTLATGPTLDQGWELLVHLFPDGSIDIRQSIGGAAETAAPASAAAALQAQWSGRRFYLNAAPDGTLSGFMALDDLKLALGSAHSFDEMRVAA